jgi:subtilisin family serine protease
VLVIAPAGNDASYRISFPGNVDGVVAVGATDKNDKIAAFSNYGGKILFASGVGINAIAFGKSESKSGTAYAAGVAGGIFAILWSQKPGLTRQQLVSFVIDNAAQIEDASGGQARRIDAQAALNAIKKLAP